MSDTERDDPIHGAFNTTSWSASDAAGLLPSNIPARRIARAWERQPFSPFSASASIARAGGGSRKVWRRVRMPTYGTTGTINGALERAGAAGAWPGQGKEINRGLSPKKAVKKLCLQNPFGREWRTTEWERPRGSHTRKVAPRPPIILRSGTVINPDFDDSEPAKQEVPLAANERESDEDDEEDDDDNDDDDDGDYEQEELLDEIQDLEDEAELSELKEPVTMTDSEWEDVESDSDGEEEEQHIVSDESDSPDAHVPEFPAIEQEISVREHHLSPTVSANPVDSPLSEPDNASPIKSPAKVASPLKASASPVKNVSPRRSTASETSSPARAAETATRQTKQRPRISDDTAILHAFLSRANASKKPAIARRESLTNRRDSGMVRQALASPSKPEVLAELDRNSPSPHKVARQPANIETITDEMQASLSPCQEANQDEQRSTRRSSRTRVKPALLLDQTAAPSKGPSKITFRGPVENVALKRSDVQELAAQTRSNTRKNKGQAVMPLVRLVKLTAEAAELEKKGVVELDRTDSTGSGQGKNVQWDSTLEYFSDAPAEPSVDSASNETETAEPASDGPSSPNKGRSSTRKAKAVKIEAPATPHPEKQAQQPVEQQAKPSTPAPAATKRRSRIATPAKGLLSRAALLPDDLSAEPPTPAAEPVPATKKTLSSSTAAARPSLPAPRRIAAPTAHQSKPVVQRPSSATAPTLSSPAKKPAFSSSLGAPPAVPVFAPRIPAPTTGISFEDALARDASAPASTVRARPTGRENAGPPGLNSPAKRRRENPAADLGGAGAVVAPPGLSSPAKRRRGVVV